ncbi:MAG: GAF domain-containing protein, partial [Candidatus Uhrbacteria bacterium]|nr:GAF domain-containing protein [Candidatus Uhrbacteria bacterium]
MSSYNLLTVLGGSVALVGIVILWFATRYERKVLRDHEQELKSKILQVSLLREITDRIGYTFDVMEIIEVISGSLGQLVEFSTVSYLVLDDKEQDIKVKIDVRDKVNQKFIFEVQEKMINAFSVLREESSESYTINRRVVGLVPDEEFRASLSSFFNLPLIIGGEVVGLINVASTKEGLYSAKDTEILYSITGFASSAVHRLRKLLDGEQYKMNAMVSSLANGLLMVDKDENVSVINSKAIEVLDLGNIEDIMLHNVISRTRNFFDLLDKIEQSKQSNGPVIQTDVIIKERFYNFV